MGKSTGKLKHLKFLFLFERRPQLSRHVKKVKMTSSSGQDRIIGTGFTFLLRIDKNLDKIYETMALKTLDIR